MKKQVRAAILGASLLMAGTAFAQNVPAAGQQVPPPPPGEATPPPPPGSMPPPPPPPANDATMQQNPPAPAMPPQPASAAPPPPPPGGAAAMNTPQGQVTVNSAPAPAKPSGPAPDFKSLAGKKGYITEKDASQYPLLANDFDYASHKSGKVTKAQYEAWVKKSGASGQ
ncbi:MAG: hypothetical protein GAK28_00032 [Luteibacter sp.]|uniref:hypothetical protein n=1 Tax=Luteibacter sp. TaxID=1886636 RepID=UPI00137E3932|nr:hypothetical protein [Luteibacter sp.]KAF1009395.1 MAG: hypothetical protein GAK28_00032 [Luteibacter sp.]